MKRKLLILCACLFGALTGVKAYTTADLTAAGWTLVTSTETLSSGANSNVYVLVDAGASTYFVMRGANLADRPKYVSLSNPFATPGVVWTLESRGTNKYAMRNLSSHYYLNSSANGYDDFMDASWTNSGTFDFAYSDAKWDITNSSVVIGQWSPGQYMGPWDGGSSVTYEQNVACNKDKNNAPGFKIYSISRSDYAKKYLKQTPNLTAPVDVTFLIINPNIYQGGAATDLPTGWYNYGDHETDDGRYTESTGDTRLCAYREVGFLSETLDFDYYSEISGLIEGNYRILSKVFVTEHVNVNLYINGTTKVSTNIKNQKNVVAYTNYLTVPNNGEISFGMEADASHSAGFSNHTLDAYADDFELQVDPYISSMATGLPANGAMTAGLWYHFNVASAGKYVIAATTLNDIIYATGSTTTLSAAGSNKFTDVQNLSAGDYYVRSSSANTLTVTSCISTVAAELPANGEMTANDWYYFDIATAGHYDVVAGSLGNIVYTTDGNLAEGASVASKFSVKNNNLTATRYYVKSSSAQTLKWFLTDEKDYTSYIKNPSFDDEISAENWTLTNSGTEGYYVFNRVAEGGVEEYNRTTIKCEQTITNLPNGIYKVTVQGYYRGGGGGYTGEVRNAKLFANDEEVDIMSINDYKGITEQPSTGNWTKINDTYYVPDNTVAANYAINTLKLYNNEVMVAVSNGTMTIGVKKDATVGNDWTYFDNFTLTYTGPYNEVVESGETQTYEGTFTENTVVTPTVEYPIVNISGASFTGTLTANFTSDQNGFIIATAEQKAALGDVKNVVVENTCDNLVLTDGVKAVIPAALTHATEATYSRTIGASTNFGTICVPFALESNDDIQYYTVKSISGDVLTLVETSTVDAGVPAVYKKKGAYAEETNIVITSSDADVEDEAGTQGATVQLIGTFTGLTVGDKDGTAGTAANGNYYIGTDNRFYQGANYITVNPFRAYITGSGENAARLTIQIEDENGTTSIVALEEFENENNLKDGKYLIDGKIVIVKNGVKYSANGQILK